ncbi:hypothetical protein V7157_27080, partial [Neobacillus drentensis]|uniref:hypothetical protein n=1 Tax=Neobacillus drentensis TaxID=220684 RepID=UPI00300239D8
NYMYANNLISTIKNMNKNDFEYFESTAYEYHINHLNNHRLRKADFKVQLQNFITGETTKITFQNLDSYLYALDQMKEDGSYKALKYGIQQTKPLSWRELFLRATSDFSFPKGINRDHLDDYYYKTLKSTFRHLLEISASGDKSETQRRLKVIDDFLSVSNYKMELKQVVTENSHSEDPNMRVFIKISEKKN